MANLARFLHKDNTQRRNVPPTSERTYFQHQHAGRTRNSRHSNAVSAQRAERPPVLLAGLAAAVSLLVTAIR